MRGVAREPQRITSLGNERVKAIRALEMRKERRETGLFVAEGASILATARDAGFAPVTLVRLAGPVDGEFQRSLVSWASGCGAEVLEVSEAVLAKLAAKDNPQTMLSVFRQRFVPLPDPAAVASGDTWVVLEEIRDPGNLGTILRTVDAVGGAGVVLVGTCCDPYARETVRATMGSIFTVPVARAGAEEIARWLAAWRGDVVGTHLRAPHDFRDVRYAGPVALVMGREGPGLSDAMAGRCTRLVKIPMAGTLDSLNLAVATALTLYQIRGPALRL